LLADLIACFILEVEFKTQQKKIKKKTMEKPGTSKALK